VPWLWVQTPSKSSTNELCNEFFLALDHILETDYYKYERRSKNRPQCAA
jgi:hypothetical protein